MINIIGEVCRSINNYFALDRTTGEPYGAESGFFTLAGGSIGVSGRYAVGQFVAITGSVLSDGVYQVAGISGQTMMLDVPFGMAGEKFEGTIYSLRVPREFIALVEKIKTFSETSEGQASNITSASFGIQSMSFATDQNGVRAGWQTVFRNELHKYRRMFPDIEV